jgi:5-formyltetrahydrofolate cyclo-ligase
MGSEAPTDAMIEFLHERGFRLCLPRIDATAAGKMEFCAWHPDDILVPGPLKIPEPGPAADVVTPDVILAPMVGFDRALNRIGNGAGYYDRMFERLPDVRRIGLAWSSQMVDRLPVEPWDIPLHLVVTESAIFEPVDG